MQLRGENNWNLTLITLITHIPITSPDPVEAIKFRMDQSGLTIKDLEPIIGKSNRVYEVLNRKRPLTLAMIRRLHHKLGHPGRCVDLDFSPASWRPRALGSRLARQPNV